MPKSKQASAISFSKFQLAGLVCGVVAVTALVTYLVAQNLSPKQVVYQPSAKLQAPVDAKPVIAAASAEDTKKTAAPSPSQFDSVEKITSRVVKNDKGGLDRIIYFPPFEIGEVFVVDEHFERFGNMELAKGKVVIPSDDRLRFTVVRSLNQETILHPQIIKKIEPTLFSDLGISNNDSGFNLEAVTAAGKKVETFDAGLDAPTLSEDEAAREKQDVKRLSLGALQSSPEALEEGQKQILINAQSWVNLRAVTFEFATITDGMVDALLGLKKLQCLRLIDTETVSPKLEVSPVLTTLKIMEFRNYDPKFLWAKPESYRELMDLSIDCQMTPQALASLKKLPQLRRLRMRQHSYVAPPSLINWIASSKLAWVTFDEAHISPQDVKRILANPNIERLRVNSKLKPTLDSLGLIDPHRLSYVSGSVID